LIKSNNRILNLFQNKRKIKMRVSKLIKKLKQMENDYGNIEVKLPQECESENENDENIKWNANITYVKLSMDDGNFIVVIY